MPSKKAKTNINSHGSAAGGKGANASQYGSEPPRASGRWLVLAIACTVAAAALCAWGALCLLFWQGSWQLLYHPGAAVANPPESAGPKLEQVAFGVTEEGMPRLKGWWIPAEPEARFSRFTVLFLHSQTGNLGDAVDALQRLHAAGVNVLAFDYRGYGQSQFVRPSEARWRQDAEWALEYLTATRHISAGTIVLDGQELGANLALEVAAAHPELAGVIVESPIQSPMDAIFHDPRARLVPARWLVRDRYDLEVSAAEVHVPVLWIQEIMHDEESRAYAQIKARKMMVELDAGKNTNQMVANALASWFDQLPAK
jgi:pimeloyl-ACP methyl ester carboxylesterase